MTFSTCDFGALAWERRNGWLFFWEERHSHSTHAHKGIVMAFFFFLCRRRFERRGMGWPDSYETGIPAAMMPTMTRIDVERSTGPIAKHGSNFPPRCKFRPSGCGRAPLSQRCTSAELSPCLLSRHHTTGETTNHSSTRTLDQFPAREQSVPPGLKPSQKNKCSPSRPTSSWIDHPNQPVLGSGVTRQISHPTTEKTPPSRRDSTVRVPPLRPLHPLPPRDSEHGQPSPDPDPRPRPSLATQGPEVGGGAQPHRDRCCWPVTAQKSSGSKPLCEIWGITRVPRPSASRGALGAMVKGPPTCRRA